MAQAGALVKGLELSAPGQYAEEALDRVPSANRSWWALCRGSNGKSVELRQVRVTVAELRYLGGDESTVKHGRTVSLSGCDTPVLLANLEGAHRRWLVSANVGHSENRLWFNFRDKDYDIEDENASVSSTSDGLLPTLTWRLFLRQGEARALLLTHTGDGAPHNLEILWAGDLDGDGKPDFILSETTGDATNLHLFLSAHATPEQWVREAAAFRTGN
jgi:hypothetical protein